MERLKNLRKKRHYSQTRLAFELNVSQETISGYETGKASPPADMLTKLADCLSTTTDYLLGRTDISAALAIPANELKEKENGLILNFRRLAPAKQERVMGYIDGLLE